MGNLSAKARSLVAILILRVMMLMMFGYTQAIANHIATPMPTDIPGQIYIGKVMVGQTFHNDPMCPNSSKWFLPMEPIDRAALSQERYSYFRPCLICASEEYEAYLTSGRFTEEAMTVMRDTDEQYLKLMNCESFTLEDWSEINPSGPDVIPDETDIPREDAIRMAAEAVSAEYDIDLDFALSLITMLRCFGSTEYGGFEYKGRDDFKRYSVTLLDLEHSNFYYVDIMSPIGDITRIEKSNFSHLW